MKADGSVILKASIDGSDADKELANLTKKIEKLENDVQKTEGQRAPIVEQLREAEAAAIAAQNQIEALNKELAESEYITSINRKPGEVDPMAYMAELENQKRIREELKRQEEILRQKEKLAESLNKKDSDLVSKLTAQTAELNDLKGKAGDLAQRLNSAAQSTEQMNVATKKANKQMSKFALRVRAVVRSALVFTVITQALGNLRNWVGAVVKTNEEATAAIAKLKGALLTLAQPLVEVIVPAFAALVTVLSKLVSVVAQLISFVFGKTAKQSAEAAKTLNEEVEALENVGSAAEDAAGSLAGFDEINVIQTEKGSSATEEIVPDFSIDTELSERQLSNILDIVKLIGGALLGWKIGSALKLGMKETIGLMIAVYGAIEFVTSLFDAWTNGVSWDNLQGLIFGLTLAVVGLYAALGPVAAGIAAVVGGLAMLAVGFKDAFKFGWTLENLLTSVAGLFATGLGISLLTGSLIPALIGGIAALLLAITVATGHGEELLSGLKESFQGFVDFFKGIFTGDMEKASGGIEKIFGGLGMAIGSVVDGIRDLFDGFFVWLDEKTGGKLTEIINFMRGLFDGLFDFVDGVLGDILDAGKLMLQGLLDFISGVFTGDWDLAWQGVKKIFSGIWNGIIGVLEGAINLIIRGINWLITQLNKISFTVPDWVPGVGGKSIGINIPKVNSVTLPRLATGAVIPPNREFLAVLGDQKQGTNIEAPEDLIRKIVREEAGGMNTELLQAILEAIKSGSVIVMDGKVVARNQVKHINNMTQQAGKSVLIY